MDATLLRRFTAADNTWRHLKEEQVVPCTGGLRARGTPLLREKVESYMNQAMWLLSIISPLRPP